MSRAGPRVAVYGIARNEEGSVERWANSARDADEVLLVDTGSTDRTVERAASRGVAVHEVEVAPFRFDVARNRALDFVSYDIDVCVPLDLDETLGVDWRRRLEDVWTPNATRVEYWLEWSPSPTTHLRYRAGKIHARHGVHWRRPVHERVVAFGKEHVVASSIQVRHHRAVGLRPNYLALLRLAVAECPADGQAHHMLANEARLQGSEWEARDHAETALTLPLEPFERMHSMLMLSWLNPDDRVGWILRACEEFPEQREPWCELARLHAQHGRWHESRRAAFRALRLAEAPDHYLMNTDAWGPWPDRLVAEASDHLGDRARARYHARRVLAAGAPDPRLEEVLAQPRVNEPQSPRRRRHGTPRSDDMSAAARPMVVVSMTTVPWRIHQIETTVHSLLAQTFTAYELELYIPFVCLRTSEPYDIPDSLQELARTDSRLHLRRLTTDYGPATKLLGPYLAWRTRAAAKNLSILTVDDDVRLERHAIEELVTASARYPQDALGFMGVANREFTHAELLLCRGQDSLPTGVLGGYRGILYPMRALDPSLLTDYAAVSSRCGPFLDDDHLVAWNLARRGITRRIIATGHPTPALTLNVQFLELPGPITCGALGDTDVSRSHRCLTKLYEANGWPTPA